MTLPSPKTTLADECRAALVTLSELADIVVSQPDHDTSLAARAEWARRQLLAAIPADDAFRNSVRKLITELAHDAKCGMPQGHSTAKAAEAVRDAMGGQMNESGRQGLASCRPGGEEPP